MCETRVDVEFAPGVLLRGIDFGPGTGKTGRGLEEAVGGVGAAAKHEILDEFAQLRVNLSVDLEHPGIDDGHVEPRLDGVVEEDGVDGLADLVVAGEGERDVGQTARGAGTGAEAFNLCDGFDEIEGVAVMLRHARADGEDVGVENDVLRVHAGFLGEDTVGATADADLIREGGGLALLVEGHDDHRRAVAAAEAGAADELGLPFLERDRVHDGLTLDAAQAGLDDIEVRRINHERHPGDIRLGCRHIQELRHRRGAVEQSRVEVDVDDRGAGLDLLLGDAQGGTIVALFDVALEDFRASDVGALADVHEITGSTEEVERLEAG